MKEGILIPFLDGSARYCRGVELGLAVLAPMLRGEKVIYGYFRSLNEEQIRLAAHRVGYTVTEDKAWKKRGRRTGWVWMVLKRNKRRRKRASNPG